MKLRKINKGFTLIETLVASTILCGSVLAITAVSSKALSNTVLNRHYETALLLADRQLDLIDYIGIDEFIDLGNYDGEFTDYELPYKWHADVQYENLDDLYYVTVTISWNYNNRPYSVSIDTMLNGVSIYTESDTGQ